MGNKKSPRADGLVAYLPAGSLDTQPFSGGPALRLIPIELLLEL
jgi:hypothetical protein